jgi:hypothetical protein
MNYKILSTTLVILIFMLTGALIYVLFFPKVNIPVQTNPIGDGGTSGACTQDAKVCPDGTSVGRIGPNCEFPSCPKEQGGKTVLQPAPAPAVQDNLVYANNEYGFQITIPKGYPDWKAMVEKDYGGKGVTYIHMIFKTSDQLWSKTGEENFVTHEKFPGYASIFAFTAWEKSIYDKTVEECKKDPNPGCPSTILGQNSKYVFDVSLGNGVPPKDLENLRKLLDSSGDIGKALEFKTIN